MTNKYEFVIIGGGIAGTTCAERLCSLIDDNSKIRVLILSASPLVKAVTNIKPVTKLLDTFDIEEKNPQSLTDHFPNLTILQKFVSDLDSKNHKVICSDGSEFIYDKVCICLGARPKLLAEKNPYVLGIRDTETVAEFQKKLKDCRRVAVIGNGGIATELVYEIENCHVYWVIKDAHLSHIFFDAHAAKFFETRLNEPKKRTATSEDSIRKKYSISKVDMSVESNRENVYGSALGPDWSSNLPIKGALQESHVTVEYNSKIESILSQNEYIEKYKDSKTSQEETQEANKWPVYVELSDGRVIGCDLVVSATGVSPAVDIFTRNNNFELGSDGGLKVNDKMETSIQDVYAAGDSCTASWKWSQHWFQMRLWTQARQMGDYAARSMWDSFTSANEIQLDFCFEMFAHIAWFFGFKCIMLGNYDARGLGNNYELLLRCTPGVEYVKIVVHEGRVQGALLIGETDLEETFENLILNQIDVSPFGENLINPDIDIDDYFD